MEAVLRVRSEEMEDQVIERVSRILESQVLRGKVSRGQSNDKPEY